MHSRAALRPGLALKRARVRTRVSFCGTPNLSTDASTHFGFQTVREADKEGMVKQVFRDVAESYDVMNDFMSAGLHRLWKDEFVRQLGPLRVSDAPVKCLDVAGGTGDIAFRILEGMRARHRAGDGSEPSEVAVLDINDAMLGVGQQRAASKGYTATADAALAQGDAAFLSWHQGDAMALQFPDNTFDAYTIAFGIRNVTRVQDAVDEAYRVLKPGGRFMCLEFSRVPVPGLAQVYDAYSFNVIPALGEIVAGNRGAYQYLVESIRKFPDQETFAGMISSAGFQNVSYENFTAGVCAVHSGFKPMAPGTPVPHAPEQR